MGLFVSEILGSLFALEHGRSVMPFVRPVVDQIHKHAFLVKVLGGERYERVYGEHAGSRQDEREENNEYVRKRAEQRATLPEACVHLIELLVFDPKIKKEHQRHAILP